MVGNLGCLENVFLALVTLNMFGGAMSVLNRVYSVISVFVMVSVDC